MDRRVRISVLGTLIPAFCLILWCASRAIAADTELREYDLEIDGKASGKYYMTITIQDSGIESVKNQASISYKHIFGTYTYVFQGVEHWQNGRLIQMTSSCNDDGTKTEVTANVDKEGLRLTINGRDRNCRGDVWTTSYWKVADPKFHNQAVPLLDADTGKEMVAQLRRVGEDVLEIGGKKQNCYHFRVTGGPISPLDLWYDGQLRLVRQEFTDHGKRVVVNLASLKK
jgi:hypothetical protein